MRKWFVIGGLALFLAIAAPIGWYLASPLFRTTTVNEEFPSVLAGAPTATAAGAAVPTASPPAASRSAAPSAVPSSAPTSGPAASAPSVAPLPSPAAVSAPPAATGPTALRTGQFHDVVHAGAGTASIVRLADGKYVLRLEELTVDNGPDLYVYLSALPDSTDSGPVLSSKFLSVAKLKGNKGNQTYELPADFDPATFNSVVIWCQQFRVNFATAPLK